MRLRNRLSLLFCAVILVGSAASLVLVRLTTENLFRSFVFSGDAAKAKVYATILSEYYSANRSWEKAQAFLSAIPTQVFLTLDEGIRGVDGRVDGRVGERGASSTASYPYDTIRNLLADRIAVADAKGVIVADSLGKLLGSVHPARHLAHGYPILVDFERVGTVLVGSMVDSSLTGIDERFLASVSVSILWATLGSSLIALLIGLLFANRVTVPLASLNAAARRVAAGDLSPLVTIRSGDEIAELSVSFNAMTEELRRLEKAKKRIIADAAHELRTPVTLIQGTVEAMIDGVYPLDISGLQSMHEETIRLSSLIDALRELETIESGELELDLKEVDPLEISRRAVSLFAAQASAKKIELSVENRDSGSPRLIADYLRLSEVIYNLISNAIKYSPEGSRVRVSVGAEEAATADPEPINATGKRSLVCIAVDDSGPGIPKDERERIFERFYRIDRSRAQDSGGRGLGLAIASEIVKAHGGRIEVGDSDLGGSSFVVTLPAP
jgi:two-component system OmpR family sensor kinase/two-component system sensor histidine kinase BaeS